MPTALITGANRGIGYELARQYLNEGWDIIALVRNSSGELDALAEGGNLTIVKADLTNDDSLRSAVAEIEADSIDLLVNNAGTMGRGTFSDSGMEYQKFGSFDREEWADVFNINVYTPMAMVELLVDKLKASDKAVVVTISSMLGSNAMNSFGNLYAYRASKAAVNSIMKSLGMNLKGDGIISIAVHPGWVRTEMGGSDADISAQEAVSGIRSVVAGLTINDAGRFIAYDGKEMPY